MEHRPSPPVTIEGGPNWAVDRPSGETIGLDAGADRTALRMLLAGHRTAVAVVLAAAVGFGVATLAADWRIDRLGETEAGELSLEVEPSEQFQAQSIGRTKDGRPARIVLVEIRNTGPRAVALERVSLEDTGWAAEDVRGRRVASGDTARVALVRAVDCAAVWQQERDQPERAATVLVRAVTDAGTRERRLPGAVDGEVIDDGADRRLCGELAPAEAVQPVQVRQRPRSDGVDLYVELANISRHDLTLTQASVADGLQVQVLDGTASAPLPMPLRLPAGDFSEPHDPFQGPLASMPLVLRVTVVDCGSLAWQRSRTEEEPLVELDVASATLSQVVRLGTGYNGVPLLRTDGC